MTKIIYISDCNEIFCYMKQFLRFIYFESCKPTNVLIYILIFCIIHNHLIIGGAKRMLAIKKGTYPD